MIDKLIQYIQEPLTYRNLIRIKLVVLSIDKELQTHKNDFDTARIMFSSTYGVVNNPYDEISSGIGEMNFFIKSVKENLTEEWLLNLYESETFGKYQCNNFNLTVLAGRGDSTKSIQRILLILNNYKEAMKLYQSAVHKRVRILGEYLGISSTGSTRVKDDVLYKRKNDQYYVIQVKNAKELNYTTYGIDSNWNIWSSPGTFNVHDMKFEQEFMKLFPDEFV